MKVRIFAALLMPAGAWAHTDGSHLHTAFDGLVHPFHGLDHLLALIASGLCVAFAARAGGSLRMQLALAGALTAGIASAGALPAVNLEPAIAASLIVLGAWVAVAKKAHLGLSASILMAALFAHGWVHGQELAAGSSPAFVVGLVASSAAVVAASALAGQWLATHARGIGNYLVGAAVALTGVLLSV